MRKIAQFNTKFDMKKFVTIILLSVMAMACGMLSQKGNGTTDDVQPAEVIEANVAPTKDIDTLSVEERVEYYLLRYSHETSTGEKASAEATRAEMMEWLNSLSDEDKRRADDASDEWYGKNAHRI